MIFTDYVVPSIFFIKKLYMLKIKSNLEFNFQAILLINKSVINLSYINR